MTAEGGWAVIRDGKIDMRTVSDTRRAAIVSWLTLNVRRIYDRDTVPEVERVWERERKWLEEELQPVPDVVEVIVRLKGLS